MGSFVTYVGLQSAFIILVITLLYTDIKECIRFIHPWWKLILHYNTILTIQIC